MKYYYDLHLHSCLSPCGSEDMTPVNLAAMCALAGLDIVALTDHNTCGNCAAFCRAAEERGLLALAGMELCTREEIHVVCLFPTPYHGGGVRGVCIPPPAPVRANHRPPLFGHQILYGRGRHWCWERTPNFLAGAHRHRLWRRYPGLAASLWRSGLSCTHRPPLLLPVWGCWACGRRSWAFPLAEVSRHCPPEFRLPPATWPALRLITNSDAHYLDQVWEAEHAMELPERTAAAVLYWLQGTR